MGYFEPMRDMTSTDWFGMRGREQDGWTAIQFKRRLDTCDSSDVPIKVRSLIDFRISTCFYSLSIARSREPIC